MVFFLRRAKSPSAASKTDFNIKKKADVIRYPFNNNPIAINPVITNIVVT